MRTTNKADAKFNVTDKLKKRALELLDESQAMQFAEGLRLNRAALVVFKREELRLLDKYGANDERTLEMTARVEASEIAKADLFARYVDAVTPPTTAKQGWAVDGFVRSADGIPLGELTVGPYDKEGKPVKGLGSATTDARGFFSITVDKLPEDTPEEVFMRAAKGRKLLESKEVRLVPENGASERVEIILNERVGRPPEPPQPDKGPVTPIPTDKPIATPTPDKPVTGATPAPDRPVTTGATPAPGTDKPATGATPPTGTGKPAPTGTATPAKPSPAVISVAKPAVITATAVKPKRKSTKAPKSSASKSKKTKARSTAGSKAKKTPTTKSRTASGAKKASTSKTRASKKKTAKKSSPKKKR